MARTEQVGWKRGDAPEALLTREWLITNSLGGYASGTVGGIATRRFHGKLIAALPAPLGRTMMLSYLEEKVVLGDGRAFRLNGDERFGAELLFPEKDLLEEFRLVNGFPIWCYKTAGLTIEKSVVMPQMYNTTHLLFRVIEGGPIALRLRPFIHFRPHEGLLTHPFRMHEIKETPAGWEITGPPEFPHLRIGFLSRAATLAGESKEAPRLIYRVEKSRGYESEGPLWSPGAFQIPLATGEDVTMVVSTESWELLTATTTADVFQKEEERRLRLIARALIDQESNFASQLVIAADQFIITPPARTADSIQVLAAGDEPRTVIAGYHWFTDWGRDTMISLEGLTLTAGRPLEGGRILRTFASYIRDGLIPNMFPEGEHEGLYHTADATMWFFHAIDRYIEATGDRATLEMLIPKLLDIIDHHLRGTRFGICVDPADGLLRQGAEGYQLTWMDAKVEGWVVTPRRGKAVEINGLFYNALRLLEGWLRAFGQEANALRIAAHAERAHDSFNRRFWYEKGGYLYDIVDGETGDDPALRPNQLFAISLRHPVLDPTRWAAVLEVVERELVTPVGLRSLSRSHPDYKPHYDGDLRARDAAYHQGTVWGWLIGPFIDAWIKQNPGRELDARKYLVGFEQHLGEACIGSISEVFDAELPFTPRGCIAQAWSVAEVLRCLVKTRG
ncbi:MAG TPA: amylo-alpha-1,6-glucosidase [Thermoanaerobaculia bacterium]|nr:amylo-alpha-1,6-glucosidase [Thermoanaerobaculia bacterium]